MAGGGDLIVTLISAPDPERTRLPPGLLAPDPDDLAASPAHLIVAFLDLPGTLLARDRSMVRLLAAVADAADAVAASPGTTGNYCRTDQLVERAMVCGDEDVVLTDVLVGLRVSTMSSGRVSLVTRGLDRYGSEEIWTTCAADGVPAAVDLTFDLATDVLLGLDPLSADTVGYTQEQRVPLRRVTSLRDPDSTLVRLDLDA